MENTAGKRIGAFCERHFSGDRIYWCFWNGEVIILPALSWISLPGSGLDADDSAVRQLRAEALI